MITGKVSVIIPNYNYARYVGEAIESALGQTYADVEVIVVDDGSVDDSRAVIKRFGDRITAVFQKNAGVAAARNNGVAASSGEFLAFLDADDVWLPEKCERQVTAFLSDENIGLVHVDTIDIDGDGRAITTHINGRSGRVAHDLLLGEPVVNGGGSGFMVRRSVFDEVGGFDTELSTSADWDLFVRVAMKYPFARVGEPLLKYRIHGNNMHQNVERMEREMRHAYAKAFVSENVEITGVKTQAMANFHRTLAGSYFYQGEYLRAIKNGMTSLRLSPAGISYFLMTPFRRLAGRWHN